MITIDLDDQLLSELDQAEAERRVLYAQKAIIIHRPDDWPSGRAYRNCGYLSRFPCRPHAWGFRILPAAGWTQAYVAELVQRAETGAVPWQS